MVLDTFLPYFLILEESSKVLAKLGHRGEQTRQIEANFVAAFAVVVAVVAAVVAVVVVAVTPASF